MKRERGRCWTGLPVGKATWETPESRAKLLASRDRPLQARFDKFVSPEPNSGCWLWTGAENGVGYGVLRVNGKNRMATHVALELAGKPMPEPGMFACHRCDFPPCVNPDHLFWGSQSDNMQDMARKGRRKASA